ncbi:uncharacterized protein VTP21DRAFT_10232 [Calcarisporiella thermophila]|uniref:uncharacterized protein n=1 Tax=Calcarisporiella thermophila TaxID=911321 RepID=UPI003743FD8E
MTISEAASQEQIKRGQMVSSALGNIKPHDVEDMYPATTIQANYISDLVRDPQSNMVQMVFDIEGAFDMELVQSAWYKVVEANAILRTEFIYSKKGVFLIVLKNPPIVYEDSLVWNEEEVSKLQEDFLTIDRRRGFSLDDVTFSRVTVVRIRDKDRYRFYLTIHRSVVAGWSGPDLLADLLKFYSGERTGKPQFKAHVDTIISKNIGEIKEYWKSVLKGAFIPEKLNILEEISSLEREESTTQKYNLEITVDQLQQYCINAGVTIPNFLKTIWAVVLRHFARNDDVIFGYVINEQNEILDDIER